METYSELLILSELTYESRNLVLSFQRNQNILKEKYGNKWLLCTMENGELQVLNCSNNKAELEELGFQMNVNKVFDILNPAIYTNYKNHYSRVHSLQVIRSLSIH